MNLPGKGGVEILTEAKRQVALATVRFVVLTTSGEAEDRKKARAAGADDYLVKGGDLDAFVEAAKAACGVITRQASA